MRPRSARCSRRLLLAFVVGCLSGGGATDDGEVCRDAADGLRADYDAGCRDYVRCERGQARARYSCEPGRLFSEAAAACVPREARSCVRRACRPGDARAYPAPATLCTEYYRCRNGSAVDAACPRGAWFDFESQACTRGAGACYEPLCAGLPDGLHADPSQDCRRRLRCRGGQLLALAPCPPGLDRCPARGDCPAPRSAAVALPVGDAHFCSDEQCSSLCQLEKDGTHADRASGCREHYTCAGGHLVQRGLCAAGLLYSEKTQRCERARTVRCSPAAKGRCFGRADGLYRDWRDCRSWLACRRERVVARGSCEADRVWDGTSCVAAHAFSCVGPYFSVECVDRSTGFYQDLASDCAGYFHCADSLRTDLRCEPGSAYDGERCVSAAEYSCPSRAPDSCYHKPDGLYRARGAGCRGYYACSGGSKSWRVCAPGLVFDEVERACVEARSACPADAACAGRRDGYYADEASGCRDYYYCEAGERLATLTCFASRVYDGRRCVRPGSARCGAGAG